MRESEPATKGPEQVVVVGRNRRQGSRTRLLSAESAVVRGHELLGGGARGQSPRLANHGVDREVRVESAGPDGGLQGAEMYVEFLGQLGEGQQVGLSLDVASPANTLV